MAYRQLKQHMKVECIFLFSPNYRWEYTEDTELTRKSGITQLSLGNNRDSTPDVKSYVENTMLH